MDKKLVVTQPLQGIIYNIQRYTIHDGPGIRTEIFMKGCPAHCKWCSNPESHNFYPQLGFYSNRCIGYDKCGLCKKVCTFGKNSPLSIEHNVVIGTHGNKCIGCFKCAQACPSNAVMVWGKEMTVHEVMKEVLADKEFYRKSGGGITLSGGEVMVQWKFALELLKASNENHIHTCVESTLHCTPQVLDALYPYIDLMITDIKHMDAKKHLEYTGIGNELILSNIVKTVKVGMPLIIRIPIIPNHNNSEDNIRRTAVFISETLHNKVKQVQLLPYRKLGTEKYASLGISYPMGKDFIPPERNVWEENILQLVSIMKEYGVPAVAGASTKLE